MNSKSSKHFQKFSKQTGSHLNVNNQLISHKLTNFSRTKWFTPKRKIKKQGNSSLGDTTAQLESQNEKGSGETGVKEKAKRGESNYVIRSVVCSRKCCLSDLR